jgi:hypothetical protein
MDFDALAYTWFFGVEGSVAKTEVQTNDKICEIANVVLANCIHAADVILFRVRFFGGTAEVLANNYKLRR